MATISEGVARVFGSLAWPLVLAASHINRLAANPFPAGAKKLQGDEPFYRIRVGDYRVVYEVGDKRLAVIIENRHRKEVYR